MTCPKCGQIMDLTEKDTSSGRDIREYMCSGCGFSDWEDRGPALWQILHDAREADAARASLASSHRPDVDPQRSQLQPQPTHSMWRRLLAVFSRPRKKSP